MRIIRLLAIVPLFAALACSAPGEETDGSLAAAADVPIVAPTLAALPDRTAPPIEPVTDLRVPAAGEPALFAPSRLVVDADGRIFVLDEIDQTIRAISPEGASLAVLAGEGQGPGELSGAVAGMAIAGSRLLVADAILSRLTAWELAALPDSAFDTVAIAAGEGMIADALGLAGLADGSFAILYSRPGVGAASTSRAVHLGPSGELLAEYGELPERHTTVDLGGRSAPLPVARGQNQMVVSGDAVYLTGGDRYEVLAMTADGTRRWLLRAAWQREPMPDEEIDRAFDAVAGMLRAMGENAEPHRDAIVGLPERLPALQAIKADGAGRLWVFPYVHHPLGEDVPAAYWPVDVYAPDGALLYSGSIPARFALHPERGGAWVTAAGEHVYGFESDADGNRVLVRSRIELPGTR